MVNWNTFKSAYKPIANEKVYFLTDIKNIKINKLVQVENSFFLTLKNIFYKSETVRILLEMTRSIKLSFFLGQ